MDDPSANFTVTADFANLDQLIATQPARVETFLDAEAETMVNGIVLSFGVSPSRPGNPPGVDTGALRASMNWIKPAPLKRWIQDGVEYGVQLEFGLRHIAPRPFVGPEFERTRNRIGDDAISFGMVT